MKNIIIREPKIEDKENFLQAMRHSQLLHHPWVKPPLTIKEYDDYLLRAQQPNQKVTPHVIPSAARDLLSCGTNFKESIDTSRSILGSMH